MGTVFAEITLKNVVDVVNVRRGYMKEPEIRQTTLKALVDTGAATLVINEKIRQELGLGIEGEKRVTLANAVSEICKIAEPVQVHWKNRKMTCQPWVLPGNGAVLLGAIPLENMDLTVDMQRQELIGAHGDEEVGIVM